jgi:mannosylglycoprotein endo-beta-mannosidase
MMIKKAKGEGLIKGLVPHMVDGGVAIHQHADDTIMLMEDSLENARNMKFILCLFEQVSSVKINFHKSEVFCLRAAKERSQPYSEIFTCPIATMPMKYLGMPIDEKRWQYPNGTQFLRRWGRSFQIGKGNMLSAGDRLTLVNTCLSSITLYMLSFL